MKYLALACDYDETLATSGQVTAETLGSLERLRNSGRRLILVTGRELDDLLDLFPGVSLFDRVVAENGGLLHNPSTGQTRTLADPPPAEFVVALRNLGVRPLSVGDVIVATSQAHENAVLGTIRRLRFALQVILNRDSLMVLPTGVDKASGLLAALEEVQVSPNRCIGIGDAENDCTFLSICGMSVSVANALAVLQKQSDLVTKGSRGDGVSELIELLIQSENIEADLA